MLASAVVGCGKRGPHSAYGPLPAQFGELAAPPGPGPHPVVVLVHGGFWLAAYDLSLMAPLADAFVAAGIATWNVEYRRLGDGGGWPATFEDVAAAVDHLRVLAPARGLDLGRVVSVGHSAGGHLALWLAARRRLPEASPLFRRDPLPLRAAVSLAGVCDLRRASALGFEVVHRLMGGTPAEVDAHYAMGSPADLLPLGVPQTLVHGADDRVVPLALSEGYRDRAVARGDPVTLVTIPGAGHFEPIDPRSSAWPVVRESVGRLL